MLVQPTRRARLRLSHNHISQPQPHPTSVLSCRVGVLCRNTPSVWSLTTTMVSAKIALGGSVLCRTGLCEHTALDSILEPKTTSCCRSCNQLSAGRRLARTGRDSDDSSSRFFCKVTCLVGVLTSASDGFFHKCSCKAVFPDTGFRTGCWRNTDSDRFLSLSPLPCRSTSNHNIEQCYQERPVPQAWTTCSPNIPQSKFFFRPFGAP